MKIIELGAVQSVNIIFTYSSTQKIQNCLGLGFLLGSKEPSLVIMLVKVVTFVSYYIGGASAHEF